jgi:hypothetical protein
MNKATIRNILLFILLTVILFYIIKGEYPFGNDNSSFAVEQQKEITRIELSQGNNRLSLEKEGAGWLVNGKNNARRNGIQFILGIIKEMKIKSPVTPELFNSEISENGINPVKVSVYENRRLLRSFLVYRTRSNAYGNIMKIRERSKPFIVHVPGYEGDIGSAFILNELYWQPFILFNLLPSEIASVKVENFSDTSTSFLIINNNRRFVVSNLRSELAGWDSSLVIRYFSYFTRIPFESWAFDLSDEEKKRIKSGQPLIRITVTCTGTGKLKQVLTLWEREKIENGIKISDSDRLWGKTENSDEIFSVRYFDIDPILKKRFYFFR